MKEAIATYLGWRCPECKRFIKSPKAKLLQDGIAYGFCQMCKTSVLFKVVNFKQQEVKKTRDEYDLPPLKSGMDPIEVIEKYWKDLFSPEILDKYFNGAFGGELRIMPINFMKHPLILRALEKYAKERQLSLSDVVIGFAAKGYMLYHRKAHQLNCPACSSKMEFIYNESKPSVWRCKKCQRLWREIPPEK